MASAAQPPRTRPIVTGILAAALVATGTVASYQLLSAHMSGAADAGLSVLVSCAGVALAGSRSLDVIEPALTFLAEASTSVKIILGGLVLIVLFLVARVVLDAFPNSGDEYAYVLQAQTYAQGQLWVDPPPLAEAFELWRFQIKNGMWLSQYAPGWALVLTPAALIKVPLWVVNPVLGVILLFAFWALAREQVGPKAAATGVIAIAGSAFFILNAASYFSHVMSALCGILYSLYAVRFLRSGKPGYAVLAGAFVGLLGLTRTFNAIIFMLPFVATLVVSPSRRSGLLPFMLGGSPFAAALLAFNQVITGDPFVMVQDWVNKGHEPIGVLSASSLYFRLGDFARLVAFTSPLLVIGFIPAFFWLWRRHKLAFTDWIAPITVVAFVFYAARAGNQYGPRYFFEAFPFAILTIAKALDGSLFKKPTARWNFILASALLVHLSVQAGYLVAALAREHQVIVEREDIYRKVADAHLKNAVVLVGSTTGKIRQMSARDLLRNGLHVGDQPVIYARNLGTNNLLIKNLFPERSFYLYSDGKLTPLR
jgi:hypothetical protein